MSLLRKKEDTHLHFVGIGGIGMSGIAEVFLNQGYRVSGSDLVDSEITRHLQQLGAQIYPHHQAQQVHLAHVVITSSAVHPENPEIKEAKKLRIPVIPRAEMLGELMRGQIGIAIAGTHGKTTTTSMLATILTEANLDPTLIIGGKLNSLGGRNAKLGQGPYIVVEADESDGSFLHLPATLGVITNIDNDHLDHFGNLTAIDNLFIDFVGKLPFYGTAVVCADDPGVQRCLSRWTKPYKTYGFSAEWDLSATHIQYHGLTSEFEVVNAQQQILGKIELPVPGKHNILNALATLGIAEELDIPFDTVQSALKKFQGVKRRFDIRWQNPKTHQMIIDDYAHHPTEIRATLETARRFWPGRLITIFQPHRYTRTMHCLDGFLSAFRQSDCVLITDIYPAGEDPIPGVDGASLVHELKKVQEEHQHIFFTKDWVTTQQHTLNLFQEGDLILCLGAGDIPRLTSQLVASLSPQ